MYFFLESEVVETTVSKVSIVYFSITGTTVVERPIVYPQYVALSLSRALWERIV